MDHYHQTREAILTINQQLTGLIHQAASTLGHRSESHHQWEQTTTSIARHILDQVVCIAVVGAIKSGKSTLVNSLLAHDYLKRGAGVVTSIVTRIREGDQLKARLFLKSWDEINTEMNQALILFPNSEWLSQKYGFDIRRETDRQELQHALNSLNRDMWVGRDGLNANSVLLSSYLKGYPEIHEVISSDQRVMEFDAQRFSDHRNFVGQDALAVYLKDVQLDIVGNILAGSIELADCQGSDSPNPLHMAMIQDYLLKAHLIVYVISSRTGLRQADIRFLTMIKRMGIGENMLFVCNCDFNEHDTLDDLHHLIQRIREELTLVVGDPQLFTVSALYHLFRAMPSDTLTEKDHGRRTQWENAPAMVAFSQKEMDLLQHTMVHKWTRERSALLLRNQLERVDVTIAQMSQTIGLNRDFLRRDKSEVDAVAKRMQAHQRQVGQIQSMVQSTLDGAVQKIQKELKKETDRFFDRTKGPVVAPVVHFIHEYQIDITHYQTQLGELGFMHCLYGVFQEFKQAMDQFVTEKVNPEILGFITQQEKQLTEYFQLVAQPFEAMTWQVLSQFEEILEKFNVAVKSRRPVFNSIVDMNAIKQAAGISLPPSAAGLRYSAEIKTEAILRLGVYNLFRFLRKAVRRAVGPESAEGLKALQDGIQRIKRETERSVLVFYKDFQENVKFQYLLRLADLASARVLESLTEQLRGYTGDLNEMVAFIEGERGDKAQLDQGLDTLEKELAEIGRQLEALRPFINDLDE